MFRNKNKEVKVKKRMKKKTKIIIGVVVTLLILSGVGGFLIFSGKADDILKLIEPKPTIPEKRLMIVDETSKTRPIAVMINNHSYARPYHSGLNDAFIVYEMVVEGGITRMMALYKDQDNEKVGGVRSARHYYLDYALENDAIYVHWGQSPQAQSDIRSLGVNTVSPDNTSAPFFRDNSLYVDSEHKAFVNLAKVNEFIKNKGYRNEMNNDLLLNYTVDGISLEEKEGAIPANSVSITYSAAYIPSFQYDPEMKLYKRFYNGAAHSDYVTKEQFTTKNIITYQVSNYTMADAENKGRQDLNNIGSGTGYYITNGFAVPITWEKSSRSAQTVYKYTDGTEIDVNDGRTYIQIQPTGQNLSIS